MDEKKNKATGMLATIGFHALIVFLLFIMPGFKSDIPFFGGQGIEVSLGSDVEGGSDGRMAALGSPDNTPPPPAPPASGENSPENAVTDDNSESNIVVPKKDKKIAAPQKKTTSKSTSKTQSTATTSTETKAPDRKVDQASTYKKNTGNPKGNDGGDPTSNGYGGPKTGDRGKETGDPKGNPDGDQGNTHNPGPYRPGPDLKGRSVRNSPTIDNDFKYEGVLRLEITVDRDGNITKVKVASGTTVTDLDQRNKAIQQIRTQLKFNHKADADEDQSGYYTIIYKKH